MKAFKLPKVCSITEPEKCKNIKPKISISANWKKKIGKTLPMSTKFLNADFSAKTGSSKKMIIYTPHHWLSLSIRGQYPNRQTSINFAIL